MPAGRRARRRRAAADEHFGETGEPVTVRFHERPEGVADDAAYDMAWGAVVYTAGAWR